MPKILGLTSDPLCLLLPLLLPFAVLVQEHTSPSLPAQRGAPGGAGSRRDQISMHRAGAAPILPDALLRWLAEIRCPARKVDLMRFLLLF